MSQRFQNLRRIVAEAIAAAMVIVAANLAAATAAVQAAIYAAFAASGGAALVGFLQAGTGAVTRTLQSKMRDVINVKDFGAVGDGVADDTAAIQAAIDAAGNWNSVNFAKTLYVPSGVYKTTAPLMIRPYVSIQGDGNGKTIFRPAMAAGPAFNSDSTTNAAEAYLVRFSEFAIDGTDCTGNAYAWLFKVDKSSTLNQIRFWNFTGTNVPAVSIQDACYLMSFDRCSWYNNFLHLEVIGTNPAIGQFPTVSAFRDCLFDLAKSAAGQAVVVRDASAIAFKGCVFQSNETFVTLLLEATAAAATSHDHLIEDCWFEDNGNSQVGSIAIYLKGVAAKKVNGSRVVKNNFHQSGANLPTYQLQLAYTDKTYIGQNAEGYGGTFLKDGTFNTNVFVEGRNVSATEINYPVAARALGNFGGLAGVVQNFAFGVVGIVRVSAGIYEVTMSQPMASTSYVVNADAENGAAHTAMLCSTAIISSTVFRIITASSSTTAADARTVKFSVFGV